MALQSEKRAGQKRDPEIEFTTSRREANARRRERGASPKRNKQRRRDEDDDQRPAVRPPLALIAVFVVPLLLLGLWAAWGG